MQIRSEDLTISFISIWMAIIIFFMILAREIDIEIFFALVLIGMIVVSELSDFVYIRPRYLRRLRHVVAVGVIVFLVIIINKFVEIIGL